MQDKGQCLGMAVIRGKVGRGEQEETEMELDRHRWVQSKEEVGRGKLGDFYHVKGKRGQGYWSRTGKRVETREVMRGRDLFVWELCETLACVTNTHGRLNELSNCNKGGWVRRSE